MFDFDPRDYDDARDRDREGIYDSRWGEDPRDPFADALDLPPAADGRHSAPPIHVNGSRSPGKLKSLPHRRN